MRRIVLLVLLCVLWSDEPRAQVVRVALPEVPGDIDPHTALTTSELLLARALYTGLTATDAGGEVTPALATSWTIGIDGLTYRFELRRDALWSDGRPIDASHVVRSIERALDPATAAPFAAFLLDIRNAEAFRLGVLADGQHLGVAARGRHVVEITLAQPSQRFLHILAQPVAAVAPVPFRAGVFSGAFARTAPDTLKPDIKLVAENSEDDVLRDRRIGAAFGFGEAAPYSLVVNLTRPPLNSRDVRHALGMVIDRAALAASLPGATPATGFTLGGETLQPPYARLGLDDRRTVAEALLLDLDRAKAAPLRLAHPAGALHAGVAATVAQAWRALGLRVDTFARTAAAHERAVLAGDFDVAVMPTPAMVAMPEAHLFAFSQQAGPWNVARYRDIMFEQLLTGADNDLEPAYRAAQGRAAAQVLVADQPVWPLFVRPASAITTPGWAAGLPAPRPGPLGASR